MQDVDGRGRVRSEMEGIGRGQVGRAGLEKSQFQGPRNYTKTYYPGAAWAFQEE